MTQVQPEDLIKFGMIPEFVGRLPVIATLHELTEDELVSILTEPRNALVKQYKKLFDLEEVRLRFTEGASGPLQRKPQKQIRRPGLRSIMENIMLDIMYDLPSQPEIQECIVNEDAIRKDNRFSSITDKIRNRRDSPTLSRNKNGAGAYF